MCLGARGPSTCDHPQGGGGTSARGSAFAVPVPLASRQGLRT